MFWGEDSFGLRSSWAWPRQQSVKTTDDVFGPKKSQAEWKVGSLPSGSSPWFGASGHPHVCLCPPLMQPVFQHYLCLKTALCLGHLCSCKLSSDELGLFKHKADRSLIPTLKPPLCLREKNCSPWASPALLSTPGLTLLRHHNSRACWSLLLFLCSLHSYR